VGGKDKMYLEATIPRNSLKFYDFNTFSNFHTADGLLTLEVVPVLRTVL
jgi:hypothetical protein